MQSAFFGLLLRHFLTAAGGALVAQGYADAATAEAIVGGAAALAGVVMSFVNKQQLLKK